MALQEVSRLVAAEQAPPREAAEAKLVREAFQQAAVVELAEAAVAAPVVVAAVVAERLFLFEVASFGVEWLLAVVAIAVRRVAVAAADRFSLRHAANSELRLDGGLEGAAWLSAE